MLTRKRPTWFLAACCLGSLPLFVFVIARAADDDYDYLVGRGMADVTGPAVGLQMWGFVREDQIDEGIHFRLFSRAFIIADRDSGKRLAFASIDLGSVTHAIHQSVVEKLQAKYGDVYTEDNVILSATHTHSGPGGYWHYGTTGPIGSPFYQEHFDAIVQGITDSIVQAHEDMQPGAIYIGRGQVEGAGANRSMTAYLNNPEAERARYNSPTDKDMTLLKFADASGPIGEVNWFASHPTAMTFFNKLISGDHKGRASARFEQTQGPGFVAAFAQSNAGDVTPNLNLDNTGPGDDDFEKTQIIADRQLEVALRLFDSASEKLQGPIDYRHAYIDFRYRPVSAEFTNGAGPQTTCPSAYGYAFAAGSTEDGGGNPLFHEGMKTRNTMIDGLVTQQFDMPEPSDRCRECQGDKAILFAPGEMNPPGQAQILPITLARIGQLTLVCVPAEFTTMSGRRLRETVAEVLGDRSRYVVLAGYANDYGGYVTTHEEYETQQYEGGHTLFGPWTLAAYRQEFARLAKALASGAPVDEGAPPVDMRGKVESTPLGTPPDVLPAKADFGETAADAKRKYRPGDTVEVAFWSGNPRNDYKTGISFLRVQREGANDWVTVATDNDWSTTCRWVPDEKNPDALVFRATWTIPEDAESGRYRIVHFGNYKASAGNVEEFRAASREFNVN